MITDVFIRINSCEVCGNPDTPLMRNGKWYCWKHDPISRREFEEIWGVTAEMRRPKTRSLTNGAITTLDKASQLW